MDPVILNKADTIKRAVKRARDEHAATDSFATDYTRQDAAILNLLRACEAAIDISQRLLAKQRQAPKSSAKEAFAELERLGIIVADVAGRLQAMVGFRNIAVHQYQELNLDIVERIIERDADDLLELARVAVNLTAD
ncbi:MAG: DUF86 domain-containing protein [Pseudomonadota bacterium]